MNIELNNYCVNLNSINRDLTIDKNPLKFTIWMNDDHNTSTVNRFFTHIKFIKFEHIVFPYYISLNKYKINESNALYNTINTNLSDLNVDVNEQYTFNNNTYEICNKVIVDNITTINFTMNGITTTSYEYINNDSTITINYYSGIQINTIGNHIQYMSIAPSDNKYIFNTKNGTYFRHVFPRLDPTSDLYTDMKLSYVKFKDSELIDVKRLNVELLDLNCKPILISNLDYNYQGHNVIGLNETRQFTDPEYYLRHPLNSKFQIDIFMNIACYEQSIDEINPFNSGKI